MRDEPDLSGAVLARLRPAPLPTAHSVSEGTYWPQTSSRASEIPRVEHAYNEGVTKKVTFSPGESRKKLPQPKTATPLPSAQAILPSNQSHSTALDFRHLLAALFYLVRQLVPVEPLRNSDSMRASEESACVL